MGRGKQARVLGLARLLLPLLAGCAAGGPLAGPPVGSDGCSDLFDQSTVRTYAIDIAPAEWASLQGEFHDVASLLAKGNDFAARHPVVVRLGAETVPDATLRLHGQSSWADTITLDGARAKMQFDVAFDGSDPGATFHGVGKLVFDMPRSDWTFLHDRLAHAWLRQAGIAAGCAASARVEINGATYGLFAVEEETGRRVIREFFPDDPGGDLWKEGLQPETNQTAPDWSRQASFAHATDLPALAAVVDLQSSVVEWAAEALINDADGTYGGSHNFYVYDQGARGFAYLPDDTDSTFDFLADFDRTAFDDHPIYWWQDRLPPAPIPSLAWLLVMNDPTWRARYVDAIQSVLAEWDVAQVQGWIDAWSGQIAADVAADPHTWATPAQFQGAVAAARDVVSRRATYLQGFVDCEKRGTGADADGDGYRWCEDCNDGDPSVHPGAPEICGNGVDDDCNGLVDDGCPGAR